ncbi:iron ABC transporter permease [Aureimonas altamirensis]|uniref:FecCD family ABC transporter permease n=1 Tax=Aureimonas altamirensis TaxID=370622 RepID=UPI0030175789
MTRVVTLLVFMILVLLSAGLIFGDRAMTVDELKSLILSPEQNRPDVELIVLHLRMPRSLLAMLVGAALGVAGAIAQAVLRNPLAEPGILGINAGAALAATILIVALDSAPIHLLPWAGFLGATTMAVAIYLLAWHNGTTSLRIILIGIGLSALAGAVTTFLTAFGDMQDVQRAMIWLAGSVYDADWPTVKILALWLAAPTILAIVLSRELDLIRFGDHAARSLGQRFDITCAGMILLSTAMSGAAVAASGLIGFVGLIAPHIARRIAGPGHRAVIPVSALVGAVLVMAADLIGRTVFTPIQIPAGIVTALIGAPVFAILIWRRRDAVR